MSIWRMDGVALPSVRHAISLDCRRVPTQNKFRGHRLFVGRNPQSLRTGSPDRMGPG